MNLPATASYIVRPRHLRPSLERLMTSAYPGALASLCLTPFAMTAVLHELEAPLSHLSLAGPLARGAGFLGIPVALAVGGLSPKRAFLMPFAVSRLCLLVIIVLLSVGWGAPTLVLGIYALIVACNGGSQGAMHTWLRAVVPGRLQPTYFGRRTAIGLAIGAAGMLAIAAALDAGCTVTTVLAIGWGMALLDLHFLGSVASTGPQGTPGLRARLATCFTVLRAKKTWCLVGLSLLAHMGYAVVLPFQLPYYYDSGCDSGDVALLSMLGGLGAALGAWIGGKVCASTGVMRSTGFGSGLVALATAGHLLLPGDLGWLMMPACVLGAGLGWVMIGFNQIMYREIGPGENVAYAMLMALLLGTRLLLMVVTSRIGCELDALGTHYAWPVFSAATLLAVIGALALCCTPLARRQNRAPI